MKTTKEFHPSRKMNILLADDDKDDCLLFKEALEEIPLDTTLTLVHDGEQLMKLLTKNSNEIFDVLFLDLNMPRINGITCLEEIKHSEKLKSLPVVIFSTSYDQTIADILYNYGAQYYICKPAIFFELKRIIQEALLLVFTNNNLQPHKKNFLLKTLKANLL